MSNSEVEKLPKQIVGNIGLFHVCYELSRRGFNVLPTSRNSKGPDVIVGSADFKRRATIQVKASTTPIGERVAPSTASKAEAIQMTKQSDFWVFVRIDKTKGFAVQRVLVCDTNKDADLLGLESTHWWYSPWREKSKVLRAKWDAQENERGWKLIADFLSEER